MTLKNNYRIATEDMLKMAADACSFDLRDIYQCRYWRGLLQQFMARIRDDGGNRLVFNVPAGKSRNHRSEYLLVAACSDQNELKAIKHRLHGHVVGLEYSIAVINEQLWLTNKWSECFDRMLLVKKEKAI